jgi:hypothetical protein
VIQIFFICDEFANYSVSGTNYSGMKSQSAFSLS